MDARVILMYDPSGYQTESRFFDRRRSVGRWWVEEWVGRFLGLVVNERVDGLACFMFSFHSDLHVWFGMFEDGWTYP